jgi:hypothetical protein
MHVRARSRISTVLIYGVKFRVLAVMDTHCSVDMKPQACIAWLIPYGIRSWALCVFRMRGI